MNSKHCRGCRDDFYNQGNNSMSGKCWGLETAKLIKRKVVHINQVPPWNQKPVKLPSCYYMSQHVIVEPHRTN